VTLILSNGDVEKAFTMDDCLAALENTYRHVAAGTALTGRRSDVMTPTEPYNGEEASYLLKIMNGADAELGIAALRLTSEIMIWPEISGVRRRTKAPRAPNNRWVGLVLLFSTTTGEPLAIFPDGVMQKMRVAATSALGAKFIARKNATTLGLLGAGWQAGAHALAMSKVRDLKEIRVYSPTKERRETFCQEMQEETGVMMTPVDSAEAAIKNSDIVQCATSAMENVYYEKWLEPGVHVSTIRDGELEPAMINAADVLVIHDPENMGHAHFKAIGGARNRDHDNETAGREGNDAWNTAPSLSDIISGKIIGRDDDSQTSCFLNYRGFGVQFAAAGAAFLHKAKDMGLGNDLPTDWFTEDVLP
jgi:alanine dehydrogenase